MRGDTLPDNHRHHGDCSDENADSKNHPPWALALAPSSRTHDEKLITVVNRLLPVGCFFLAAICTASLCHPERKRGISQSKRGSHKLLRVINQLVRDPSLRSG